MRTIRSHAHLYPADQWDTGVWYCPRCQQRRPEDDPTDNTSHEPGCLLILSHRVQVIRAGVVDHYRQMVPPPTPHGNQPDPRFADWPEHPRTDLGRYCQQIIDSGRFPKGVSAPDVNPSAP